MTAIRSLPRSRTELARRPDDASLPRLLYVGDVPVANTLGGAVLLYRLLQRYPAERLRICAPSAPAQARLPGVDYVTFDARWPRLFQTRLSPLYCAWIAARLDGVPRWAREMASSFRPQAVLTISQTCGWILAWRLAQRESLPLLMLIHDDEVYFRHLPRWRQAWAEHSFREAYRQAAARFCISPAMAAEYERRFGVSARIQYPTRDLENPVFDAPAPQTLACRDRLVFAYAGSCYGEPSIRQLVQFARAAGARGHRLLVYSPQFELLRARARGITALEAKPPLSPSATLIGRLREEADCLLVTGSFDPADARAVSLLFPSKMTDYTAMGLPLLAWAPAGASVVQFVRAHPGVAELVTDPDPSALLPAIARLSESPELRHRGAQSMLDAGRSTFSQDAAWQDFKAHLPGLGDGERSG